MPILKKNSAKLFDQAQAAVARVSKVTLENKWTSKDIKVERLVL